VSHQSSPEKPSTFTSAIPVLPTNTIEQAITFYGQLGFQTLHQDAEYAIFQRDTVELHVWLCTDQSFIENSSCRIKVRNIEGLYQEYQAKGLLDLRAVRQGHFLSDAQIEVPTLSIPATLLPVRVYVEGGLAVLQFTSGLFGGLSILFL
jgi:hypothetical protein